MEGVIFKDEQVVVLHLFSVITVKPLQSSTAPWNCFTLGYTIYGGEVSRSIGVGVGRGLRGTGRGSTKAIERVWIYPGGATNDGGGGKR